MAHQSHKNQSAAANQSATPVGVVSTGASSHTDPGSYRNDDSNPAQDLDLSPRPADRTGNSWIAGVSQLPHQLKEWGSQAAGQVGSLSTTQKVVGSALLLGGIGWLSWRARTSSADSADDAPAYDEAQNARPWGSTQRTEIDPQYRPVNGHGY